ncbi:hypothetical protein Anas_13127, partial [Armadillidium nasatum]
ERWKKSISEKFRNERDRIDSSTLPVALFNKLKSKKRQKSSNDEMESSSKKKKGLQNLKFNIEKKLIVTDMCNDTGRWIKMMKKREATEVSLEVESTSPHSSFIIYIIFYVLKLNIEVIHLWLVKKSFWSHNFKLPSFGFATVKMKNGGTLRKSEQSTILKAIFQEVVNFHGVL